MTTPDNAAQRKRIEALQADPAAQDLAASARPRAPSPEVTDDVAGKAAMAKRLEAAMTKRAACLADALPAPRSAKRKRTVRERSAAPASNPKRRPETAAVAVATWDKRRNRNLPAPGRHPSRSGGA